jgi:hypothetical protein
MKEVLTKIFWQGVKKTFYEALDDSAPKDDALQAPTEGNTNAPSRSEPPSAASVSSEQN